jgi:hypothetical protein
MMNLLQIAFQNSQVTRPETFPHVDLFTHLLELDFSVILCRYPRYCRVTDACLPGRDTQVISAFSSRDRAVEYWFAQKLYLENDPDIEYELRHPIHKENFQEILYRPVVGRLCFTNGNPFREPKFCDYCNISGFNSDGYIIARLSRCNTDLYTGNGWSSDRELALVFPEQHSAYIAAVGLAAQNSSDYQVGRVSRFAPNSIEAGSDSSEIRF